MLDWLISNIATIVVSAILLLIVGLIIAKMVKDKKAGKSSCHCGCGCEGCALSDKCKVKK